MIIIGAVGGFVGSVIDSYLGAIFQYSGNTLIRNNCTRVTFSVLELGGCNHDICMNQALIGMGKFMKFLGKT